MKRLVISGYGKMGKEIERLAILKNWQIVARIDNKMQWEEYSEIIKSADAIIDFSSPEVVLDNIKNAFEKNIPIINDYGQKNRIKKIINFLKWCWTRT